MPVFQYQAIKVGGERTSGVVTADSPRQAREQLQSQDVYVTALTTVGHAKGRSNFAFPTFRRRNLRAVSLATRQMATMLGTGLPLTDVLGALVEQVEDQSLRAVLRDVRERVNKGFSLADAFSEHITYFDELYVGMVRAGEASGRLSEVLSQLAEFCRRDYRMRSRVTSVLTYPAIMVVVGSGVVFFLLTFVVPRVTAVLQDNKVPLPTSTAILVGTGNFLSENWPYLLIGIIGLWLLFSVAKRTERGAWIIDTVKLKIPLLGTLFRKQAVARFSSTLGALLRSGLPALDALVIVREVVGNRVISQAIDEITEAVTAGQDMSMPLRNSSVFPPMVSYMVATGEQSGELDDILDKVAEELDEEVEITGQRLISLLEPMLIVFMAVIVGFIVLSIVQPILELSNF